MLTAPRTDPDGRNSRIRLVWGFLCQGLRASLFVFLSAVHSLVRAAPQAFFRSLIAAVKASAKLSIWRHFPSLSSYQVISLVRPRRRLSLAPTAGCRRRRAQVVSRLAALRGHPGVFSRGRALIRPSTTAHWLDRGLLLFLSFVLTAHSNSRRCRVHRSLRGRDGLAAPWSSKGFGAAMSRTRSPRCRGKNRAVVETRPGRDDVSLQAAVKG